MRPIRVIRVAARAVLSNKLRSTLALLGVMIGIGAVVCVMAVGNGSRSKIQQEVEGIGADLIFVRPVATSTNQPGQASSTALTFQDAQALVSHPAPDIAAVAPEVTVFTKVRVNSRTIVAMLIGTTPSYELVRNFNIIEGRFLSTEDLTNSNSVAVLGSRVSMELFGGVSSLGQTVFLDQRPFYVVGVLARGEDDRFRAEDDMIVAPLTTIQAHLGTQGTAHGERPVQLISIKAVGKEHLAKAEEQILQVLRHRHRILGVDDFVITSPYDLIRSQEDTRELLTVFLATIAAISLLLSGIIILNSMLISVRERVQEIGLRKAVGAKGHDILTQFLTEAILLTMTGGMLGVGVGIAAAGLLELLTIDGESIKTGLSVPIVLLSLVVAAAVGGTFGVYPAIQAARTDPIRTLRNQ